MIYLEAIRRISELTKTDWFELAPVRFGYDVTWLTATTYILAAQVIPDQRGLIVFRTECYTTNLDPDQPDFMIHGATPPGVAWWTQANFYTTIPATATGDKTDRILPCHITLDCDNLLLFGANTTIQLLATLTASPGDVERQIRTACYGCYIGGAAYERLRNNFEYPNLEGA